MLCRHLNIVCILPRYRDTKCSTNSDILFDGHGLYAETVSVDVTLLKVNITVVTLTTVTTIVTKWQI